MNQISIRVYSLNSNNKQNSALLCLFKEVKNMSTHFTMNLYTTIKQIKGIDTKYKKTINEIQTKKEELEQKGFEVSELTSKIDTELKIDAAKKVQKDLELTIIDNTGNLKEDKKRTRDLVINNFRKNNSTLQKACNNIKSISEVTSEVHEAFLKKNKGIRKFLPFLPDKKYKRQVDDLGEIKGGTYKLRSNFIYETISGNIVFSAPLMLGIGALFVVGDLLDGGYLGIAKYIVEHPLNSLEIYAGITTGLGVFISFVQKTIYRKNPDMTEDYKRAQELDETIKEYIN